MVDCHVAVEHSVCKLDALAAVDACTNIGKSKGLDEALQFLQSLRSVLHAFNKDIAKAEDVIAEMFCLTLQPQSAIHHCKD